MRVRILLTLALCAMALVALGGARAESSASAPVNVATYGRPAQRVFTGKDGLPQNAITSIEQDRDGYLWIGTRDGAARYDGREWTVVNMPAEMGRNHVWCAMPTSDGSVWFGTNGGGLAQLRPDGNWAVFTTKDGLPSDEVTQVAETDPSVGPGTVWASTTAGIATLTDRGWITVSPTNGTFGVHSTRLFARTAEDGVPELWAILDGVPWRLRDGSWTTFDIDPEARPRDFICIGETSAFDGRRRVIAGVAKGLLILDGDRWRALPTPGLASEDAFGNVGRLCETRNADGTASLWVGAAGGLFRFDRGRWSRYDQRTGLPSALIWSLFATGDSRAAQTLWIGTAGAGLVRWQLGLWSAFDNTTGMPGEPVSVYSLLVTRGADGSDVVWAGMITGAGLVRFERGRWSVALEAREWVRCLIDASTPDREVVWVGTNAGLHRVESGRVTGVYRQQQGLPSSSVHAMCRSSFPEGREMLWVGTTGGIVRLEGETLVAAPAGVDLQGKPVTCFEEVVDPSGARAMWVGTDGGLVRYDGASSTTLTMADGLPSDQVLSLRQVETAGGRELWAGTSAGLVRRSLDDPTAPLRVLSTSSSPALPNNTIYRIETDARGRAYLCTNKGVVRLSPREPDLGLYVYTTDDGLPNDECNTGASTVDHHGRVWVGTVSGAAMLDPAAEVVVTEPRPIQFLDKVVAGARPLVAGEELAWDDNDLSFEFALLAFHREGEIRYRTQLVGYDDQPSDWIADAKKGYTNLPGGQYRFLVWGRDAFGNVSGPVEVGFSVRVAPWLTWWAWGLYLLAVAGLVYVGIRVRVRALRRSNEALEQAIVDRTVELARNLEELRLSRETARTSERTALEANRAKSVFLANMSHELRTPLNAVLGFAQLLERGQSLESQDRHFLGIIRRSGEHLLGLINDVLSLAKIEAGKLELNIQPFDPVELLESVEAMTRVRADAKDLDLAFDVGEFPPAVLGDDGKLRQVLLNLLGNAVKFTDEGGVRLSARWDEKQGGLATFEISDTGRGIATEEIATLFTAFGQTESGQAATEGTGLGLTISRQIVRLMGGDVRVESNPGEGSTFFVDVALPASDDVAVRREHRRIVGIRPDERRRRVLVVDDNLENRLLLVTLLKSVGFEVHEAVNGEEAVAETVEWRPSVIFMDERMPVMRGSEAALEIRRIEREAAGERERVIIISTTASAFDQERESILAKGCDDMVTKPYREASIFDLLARHAGIEFEYESEGDELVAAPSGIVAEGLRSLDQQLVRGLYDALVRGDMGDAETAAMAISDVDAPLGDEIRRRIRAFEIDELMAAVERIDARGA